MCDDESDLLEVDDADGNMLIRLGFQQSGTMWNEVNFRSETSEVVCVVTGRHWNEKDRQTNPEYNMKVGQMLAPTLRGGW
jgi:hypothetical protein